VAWGVRKSTTLNNVFTTLNLVTVCTVIGSGFYFGTYLIPMFKYVKHTFNMTSIIIIVLVLVITKYIKYTFFTIQDRIS